jgi:hypothetical protein
LLDATQAISNEETWRVNEKRYGPRAWRLAEGGTLVEGPPWGIRVGGLPIPPTADGVPLTEDRTYYRLDEDGELVAVYESMGWSEYYDIGKRAYSVRDGILLWHDVNLDVESEEWTHRVGPELTGLTALPPERTPGLDAVRVLAEAHIAACAGNRRVPPSPWPNHPYEYVAGEAERRRPSDV